MKRRRTIGFVSNWLTELSHTAIVDKDGRNASGSLVSEKYLVSIDAISLKVLQVVFAKDVIAKLLYVCVYFVRTINSNVSSKYNVHNVHHRRRIHIYIYINIAMAIRKIERNQIRSYSCVD